ncbi:class I SAM-dependent methyltransferase [Bradyrhizobium sp. CCBAU 53380]|uniref:class I SAM-dependent methyltransferase n=1 Tax=Bradyrhizobium sp. CCBAU 53380 TaxID=1325117 RepID=UPI002303848B|nr:class I SAM-dependent methyltransferase [Bradyrhizobium sp. CCBAU 53380]
MNESSTLYQNPARHTYMDASNTDGHHRSILDNVLTYVGLRPGDHVIEVGSGSGRYSELLLAAGLRVTAIEPDHVLYEKSLARLSTRSNIRIVRAGVGELPSDLEPVDAVCGFHVLHHLDANSLDRLKTDIDQIASRQDSHFRGWFFVEPNPFNILYPVQITMHPGMKWREERGIWAQARYRRLPWNFRLAAGLIPPQLCRLIRPALLRRVPNRLWETRVPWALYEVFGARMGSHAEAPSNATRPL